MANISWPFARKAIHSIIAYAICHPIEYKSTRLCVCRKFPGVDVWNIMYIRIMGYRTVKYLYGTIFHDAAIKWKCIPRYGPFVWGIHRWPVNSPPKGQWRGALMFSSICSWINGWVNSRETGDLRRHRAHYDATALCPCQCLHKALHNRRYLWGMEYPL